MKSDYNLWDQYDENFVVFSKDARIDDMTRKVKLYVFSWMEWVTWTKIYIVLKKLRLFFKMDNNSCTEIGKAGIPKA